MDASELRNKRVAARISGDALSAAAGVDRSRLCRIERGTISPAAGEFDRLTVALDRLIAAKVRIDVFAAEAGWPGKYL